MSVALDVATKLHQEQVKAVTRSHDLAVSAIETVAIAVQDLRAKSPSVPGVVAAPLEKLTGPVTKLVGNRSEVASHVSRSVRDWAELQIKFQGAVLGALAPEDQAVPAAPKKRAKA